MPFLKHLVFMYFLAATPGARHPDLDLERICRETYGVRRCDQRVGIRRCGLYAQYNAHRYEFQRRKNPPSAGDERRPHGAYYELC